MHQPKHPEIENTISIVSPSTGFFAIAQNDV
jgi:hypothetical protein